MVFFSNYYDILKKVLRNNTEIKKQRADHF